MNTLLWNKVNRNLVARSIGELYFEEVLKASYQDGLWSLKLNNGTEYTFKAWETIWTHLRVQPETLLRNGETVTSAATFFIDTQTETGMSDITLGNFLEEMHNTLFSDLTLASKEVSSQELVQMNGEEIQCYLNGHPKILLNKGRMGWGEEELKAYAPESGKTFKLHWMAIHKTLTNADSFDYLDCAFTSSDKEAFLEKFQNLGNFHIIPVHPWQWKRFISIQFAEFVCQGKLIYLGEGGDDYRPQISIRTLSNVTRPQKPDIKLPVSILNTSCVRGIIASLIETGKEISRVMKNICNEDSLLKEAGVEILEEKAGLGFVHPNFKKVKDAPYRYHEYFGVIIRESAQSKLQENETAIITASLFHQDKEGASLLALYIEKSGLSTEEWLRRYFKTVVIPLYHLQVEYGVGLVAHGQNIVLKLTNFAPSGMFLKDFQGDMRLLNDNTSKGHKLFEKVDKSITKLPPHYLIHDLVTGHFITVLRFVSGALYEGCNFSEEKFYQILSSEIQAYVHGKTIPEAQNILTSHFQKVLLNKVRFQIGYADTTDRPLPLTGTLLNNPLFPGKHI